MIPDTLNPTTIGVELIRRLPACVIVGMPAHQAREAAERVRSAIIAAGFEWPRHRIVVSVSPSDRPHSGMHYDLPIAAAILVVTGQIELPPGCVLAGELALDGTVRSVRGVLGLGFLPTMPSTAILPLENAKDAVLFGVSADVRAIHHLGDLRDHESRRLDPITLGPVDMPEPSLDFRDVVGQDEAIRQLVRASKSRRTVILRGPPGCGKTMLAARCPSLLPSFQTSKAIELLTILDAAGLRAPASNGLTDAVRPFRAPHHTCSTAGMIGGASLRPGEVTLAHGGVLFLDEATEFMPDVLDRLHVVFRSQEVLRGPSANCPAVRMPATVWLIAGVNPCPCGFLGHATKACRCTEHQIAQHAARLEHPIFADAVTIDVRQVTSDQLLARTPSLAPG